MDLLPYERRQLDSLEGNLRAEEPELASKFDIFTRLARGDGRPSLEGQVLAEGAWRGAAIGRQRLCRHLLVAALVVLALLMAVIVLGFT